MSSVGVIAVVVIVGILGVAIYAGVQEARDSGGGVISILREGYVNQAPPSRPSPKSSVTVRTSKSDSRTTQSQDDSGSSVSDSEPDSSTLKLPTPPSGFVVDELSLFFDQVRLSSVQRPRSAYSRTSLRLVPSTKLKDSINVTGWTIKTQSGGDGISVPQAIEDYIPGSSREKDIVIERGESVYVYGHYEFDEYQHLFGKNIQLNKCTGYLNNLYEFDPALSKSCPRVSKDDYAPFSSECRSLISSLRTCEEPTSQEINSFIYDSACQSFLRDWFGYGNCYKQYRGEDNFFSGKWYVWLEKRIPLDEDHDRVFLFDREGLLVDEYTY